ncbi:hypothetical protein L0666_10820 [Octadecabacter sp. CECT 8868]|uniref:hypothetical protein n=1 Tax=Octadecabacter algicola TaxID=2909342 RepID=UPI001F414066|nr:hypothetical protein [Octadecabacter algicola]MCF2905483.1 hypothetical protein [Octadecabacter algicola]
MGETTLLVAPKRRLAQFDLPPEFTEVPDPTVLQDKPHYDPPTSQAFATEDGGVLVRVITEYDHDGLDYHFKDAKRALNEVGAQIAFSHCRDDRYSIGGTLADRSSIHHTSCGFGDASKSATIGTVIITFKDADDVRATALIRSVHGRLSLSES